jgi:Mannosyltransferase (PIG-V)
VLALSWPAAFIFRGSAKSPQGWLALWQNWDAVRLADIAQYGYFSPAERLYPDQIAFFPGFPIVLDVFHAVIRQWTVSGLVTSFVAGAVAVVAVSRIAERDYMPAVLTRGDTLPAGGPPRTPDGPEPPAVGRRAVLFLVVSPAAIFLAAGYTEALFLALAATSWLSVRNEHWARAVLLAGAASIVRINGLFLCAALAVEILRRADGKRLRAMAMFIPALVPVGCYELYLRVRTGSWLAWQHAEQAGWQRQLTNPINTFKTTWTAGFAHEFSAPINFVFQLEIIAVLVGVVATVLLLRYRRWPEAIYVGLTILALATSIWYESVPRSLLALWPIWCGLAVLAVRRPWVGQLYLALSIPISVSIALLFMSGNWAG